jgi:hypothetical protein
MRYDFELSGQRGFRIFNTCCYNETVACTFDARDAVMLVGLLNLNGIHHVTAVKSEEQRTPAAS